MQSIPNLNPNDDGLEAVLVEVLETEERGESRPLAEWITRYPQYTDALTAFFGDRAAFDGFLTRPPSLNLGDHLRYFGDYELIHEIARGGMGVIYLARQTNLKRDVALKMILGGRFPSPADLDRFKREAQAISQLDHPGIVALYEVGEHQGQHYFTMKLVAGGSLADRLTGKPFDAATATTLMATVARAVHYAHQRGLLHRDLKPANILLESPDDLRPLVADFGLSKPIDGGANPTRTGAILGTPKYMSPEQARAEKQLTTAADIYSLGAILYELLTGQPPFNGATIIETLDWLQYREPTSPRTLNPKLDRDLETITLKCLAKLPAERYGSAEALAEDLDRWRLGTPILARPVSSWERAAKWARRNPAVATLSAALVASLLVGLVGILVLLNQTRRAEQSAVQLASAEKTERERAQIAEANAEGQRDRAETSLGFNRVGTAYRYWQDGNLVKANELLRLIPEKNQTWEWQHLQKLMHPEERTTQGYGFILNRDQSRMFVLHNELAALWDVKACKELKQIPHKGDRFNCSPDGSRYARFSSRNVEGGSGRAITVRVFETETDKLIWENDNLPILAFEVRTVSFSPDHRLIAICGSQNNCAQGGDAGSTTVVVDGDTGATKYVLKQGGLAAEFSPDCKTLAAYEEQMEWQHEKPLVNGKAKPEEIIKCSWLWPSGENICFGDRLVRRSCWINLLDPATGVSKGKINNPEQQYVAQQFTWSPDSQRICSLGRGETEIYDIATRKRISSLIGHKDRATSIAFTTDPNQILTGGSDHTIKLWNLTEGKSVREWKGHQQYIGSLALIDNGRTLLSGSGDHTIRHWRFEQQPGLFDSPTVNYVGPNGRLKPSIGAFHWSNGYSRDGRLTLALDEKRAMNILQAVFAGDAANTSFQINLLDTKTQRTLKSFKSIWQARNFSHQHMAFDFSADERFGAAIYGGQPVILDLKAGTEHFLPYRSGTCMAFSPDGKTLATMQTSVMHEFKPNLPENQIAQPVAGIPEYIAPPPEIVPPAAVVVAEPPPGNLPPPPLLQNYTNFGSTNYLRLWDVITRKEIHFVVLNDFNTNEIVYSPDGRFIAATGYGSIQKNPQVWDPRREIRIIDIAAHKVIHVLKGSHMDHRSTNFSPDGTRVIAASWDGNVYVWSTITGELLHTLRGHQGYVWSAVFTPDNRRIISSGNDGTLKVWDAATGEEIITYLNEGGSFQLHFDDHGELTGHNAYFFRRWQTHRPE